MRAWLPRPTAVRRGRATAAVSAASGLAVFSDPGLPTFSDLRGHWAEGAVLALTSLGVARGLPGARYMPDAPETLASLLVLVARALRLPPASASMLASLGGAGNVPAWAAASLAAAARAGLLARGPLGPDAAVTRAEAGVVAARALGLAGGGRLTFTDAAPIPAGDAAGVSTTVGAGLLRGYPDGSFRPDAALTRGAAAELVLRMMRLHAT